MMLGMVRSRTTATTSAPAGAPNPPRPAAKAAEGALGAMIDRARWLDAADQRFRRHLPPALAAPLRLANVDGDTVVVLVPTPAWKARLRMDAALLLAAAHAAGLSEARTVTLKVAPPAAPSPARPGAPLSAVARATLEAAAQSVADPELRAQLLLLAASGRHPPTGTDGNAESTDPPLGKR
jgi:hypothetical protein